MNKDYFIKLLESYATEYYDRLFDAIDIPALVRSLQQEREITLKCIKNARMIDGEIMIEMALPEESEELINKFVFKYGKIHDIHAYFTSKVISYFFDINNDYYILNVYYNYKEA